jgi:hypothetical protein
MATSFDGYANLVTVKAVLSIASSLAAINAYGIETFQTE